MSEEIKNGKVDVMGINIDISQVLGQKIVDQYMAELTEDDVKKLMDYISDDLWTKTWDNKTVVKVREKDNWGSYKTKELPIGEIVKNQFNERIKEELKAKCEEIVSTQDFKDKVEQIANEIIEYMTEGYKEDLKERIKERMLNSVNAQPVYGGISLLGIINQEINNRMMR